MIIQKPKIYFLISLFFIFNPIQVASDNDMSKVVIIDGEYNIEITTSQWKYEAIDLNRVNQLIKSGLTETEARNLSKYNGSIGNFEIGARINFAVRSMDVQHGFQFKYLDELENEQIISIASIRPIGIEIYGTYANDSIVLPLILQTIIANCRIFSGLGHPDMKLEFVITEYISTEELLLFVTIPIALVSIAMIKSLSFIRFKLNSKIKLEKNI